MGVDISKAALAAGHAVVATGRDPERINSALGMSADSSLLSSTLRIPGDAKDADTRRVRQVRPDRRSC